MNNIKLKSVDLSNLRDSVKIIEIKLDNSVNIIDEMGGPDYFYIRIDISNNTIIPTNDDKNLSLLEQFTNANYAGIYDTYIEFSSFEGCYSIYSIGEENEWNLDFHGSELEDESGNINENLKEKILDTINPSSLFEIANEVLNACN